MLMGDPTAWLPQFRNLEDQVFEALVLAWPVCIAPLQSKKNEMTHEDHITNHLVQSLIRTKKLPGRIIPQYSLLIEDAAGNVRMSSHIDFVITIGDDEDVYLACECKRLNVPYKSGTKGLVGEYVKEGLMRFVTGQYSNGLPHAMMLGYVMNAKSDHALRGIKRAINVRQIQTRLQSQIDVPPLSGHPLRLETTHSCSPGHSIEVRHTLLAWP